MSMVPPLYRILWNSDQNSKPQLILLGDLFKFSRKISSYIYVAFTKPQQQILCRNLYKKLQYLRLGVKIHDYCYAEKLFTTPLILTIITVVIIEMSCHHMLHIPCSSQCIQLRCHRSLCDCRWQSFSKPRTMAGQYSDGHTSRFPPESLSDLFTFLGYLEDGEVF